MNYKFIDNNGTFVVKNPGNCMAYFPLTNKDGTLLSSISPNLAGDIKKDNQSFLTPPASIEDIRCNLLCRRDFFIALGEKTIRLSTADNDTLEAGLFFHKITKKINSLKIEIMNFIPYDMDVEIMRVKVKNNSKKNLKITPTSFLPLYGRSAENVRDHRHVSSLLNRACLTQYGITLKPTMTFDEKGHKVNRNTYFCLGFEGKTVPPLGQFPTLNHFCGDADLIKPDAIEKNLSPIDKKIKNLDGKEIIAAFRFNDKILRPNQEVHYFLIIGIDSYEQSDFKRLMKTFGKINTPEKIEKSLEATKTYWLDYASRISIDFKDKDFNNWLLWVKMQPMLRKLFGCSFLPHFDYGKGGRGWRDLWQDILTLLLNQPLKDDCGEIKNLLLKNLEGIRIDGSNATIITKEGNFVSDRNKIHRVWIDHGIWPYLTLQLYINKTGDIKILDKNIKYFKDHLIKRSKEIDGNFCQNDNILRSEDKAIYRGSVLEHILIQNLIPFFNVGKHNIICLESADWNDGLDMAAENGESVTFSFMYAYNIKNICSILKKIKETNKHIYVFEEFLTLLDQIHNPINYNDFRQKRRLLKKYLEESLCLSGKLKRVRVDDLIKDLTAKYEHLFDWLRTKEWLGCGFFNGYYDNKGSRVEGLRGQTTKMMLPSQVFSIMSGVATEKQIGKIWKSITKHLMDKKLGGFRLNTNFNSLYLDLGRALAFSYGNKENGAFFNHMTIMLANALYKRDFIKEGNQVILSIYKMATSNKSKIYPMIPEYFDNSGEGLYLYLTGSASWYIYTFFEEILGIKFVEGNIHLRPKLLPSDFFKNSIEVTFSFRNKNVSVTYIKKSSGKTPLTLESVLVKGNKIYPGNNLYIIKKEDLQHSKKRLYRIKAILV